MQTIPVPIHTTCRLLLLSLILLTLALPGRAALARAPQPLTLAEATAIAGRHIARESDTIPAWADAVAGDPQPCYGLEGNLAAYVFPVTHADGSDAGYVTVSSEPLPNPVLEFSTGPARLKTALRQARAIAARFGLPLDESKPLYLGPLAYFYRLGDGPSALLLDAGSLQVVAASVSPATTAGVPQPARLSEPPLTAPAAGMNAHGNVFRLLYGPDYSWYRGCGPTAVANLLGYWADRGYPNLVYGGSGGDFRGTIDALAALMSTTSEGWTWLPVDDDIRAFAASRGYSFQAYESYSPSYAGYVDEIDAHRPVVVLVNGHTFYGNHFVTGMGYEYRQGDESYRYMIVHDTWDSTGVDCWLQYGASYTMLWFDRAIPEGYQVDLTAPVSAVASLAPYQVTPTFAVRWSGADSGWGILGYDVQYRDGPNGVWADWLTSTTATRAQFTGVAGHTYFFRCRAADIDRNQELYPGGDGDASATIWPSLALDHAGGRPDSFFSLTGSGFPPTTTVGISVNGAFLGDVTGDASGHWAVTLDTARAAGGDYTVIARAGVGLAATFRLDPAAPLHPQPGQGAVLALPAGLAPMHLYHLPAALLPNP